MSDKNSEGELKEFLQAYPDTELLEVLLPDMNGIFRGKRLPADEISKLFKDGINYCASVTALDTKGEGCDSVFHSLFEGDPDVLARPVPGSLAPAPWALRPSGQVLLRLFELDGSPYFPDPRVVLENALKPLSDMGLTPVVATELEFYLIEDDGEGFKPRLSNIPGSKRTQNGMQYSTLEELACIDPFLAEVDQVCKAQNVPAGTALSEYAPGQFEINLSHVDDAVLACDHALLLKRAVKAVALKHGLAASFMAKPFSEFAGCGLHVHVSLLDEQGQNVFAGSSADGDFSDTLRHAIGGMAGLMSESMAIFAPNANSYRRYSPESFVPRAPYWGPNHRDLALRIPLSSPANTRVEHRVAGADANPYLVMAAIMAGIHHGIKNKCDPGVMIQAGQEIEDKVELPIRWEAALDAFDGSKILPNYLGEKYHDIYGKCRREEGDRFHAEISDRDYEWYLRAV